MPKVRIYDILDKYGNTEVSVKCFLMLLYNDRYKCLVLYMFVYVYKTNYIHTNMKNEKCFLLVKIHLYAHKSICSSNEVC